MENNQKTNTSLGLSENIEALLCYILGWITGLVFLLLEKENKFVRFHAFQSLFTFLGISMITMIIKWTPFLWPISSLITLVVFILWLLLMYKAYQRERFKLPIIGDFTEKQIYS